LTTSPEPLLNPDLAQIIFGSRGFKFLQMKGNTLLHREIIAESKNTLTIFKNLLLQNQRANINQTWYKLSLGEGNSKFKSGTSYREIITEVHI
jgi:hypothetical protein